MERGYERTSAAFGRVTHEAGGSLGAFRIWGDECELARLDRAVGRTAPLGNGSLAAGMLRASGGEVVDEVVLVRDGDGQRLLMVHGGAATSVRVRQVLVEYGFVEKDPRWGDTPSAAIPLFARAGTIEAEVDVLLSGARTGLQAALLLECRNHFRKKVLRILDRSAPDAAAALRELAGRGRVAERLLADWKVCVVGAPNTGKSTLFNRLLREERALASPERGTTRDPVGGRIDLDGYCLLLHDTAGLEPESERGDPLASAAFEKTYHIVKQADIAVLLLDGSRRLDARDREAARIAGLARLSCILVNKRDLPSAMDDAEARALLPGAPLARASALEEDPGPALAGLLKEAAGGGWDGTTCPVASRQVAGLLAAAAALESDPPDPAAVRRAADRLLDPG